MSMTTHNKKSDALIIIIFIAVLFGIGLTVFLYFKNQTDQTIVTSVNRDTQIRFGWWGNDIRHKYTLTGIDHFNQSHDGITVDCEYSVWSGYEYRYRVYMLSGTEPDVMQINFDWLSQYSPDGNGYYDLNKLSDIIDLSSYSAKDLSYGTVQGKLNALPIAYNAIVFYYNQDILDQYGLEVPRTWDDLFAAADVLSKDGISVVCMNQKHLFLTLIAWYEQTTGKKVFSNDGRYVGGKEAAEAMLSFYKKLADRHVFPVSSSRDCTDFSNGTCAGAAMWANDSSRYCDPLSDKDVKLTLADPPAASGAKLKGWYVKPATMYAISINTSHPEDSAELLNYLVNDPGMAVLQRNEKGIPVSSAARKTLERAGLMKGHDADAGEYVLKHLDDMDSMIPSMENGDVLTAVTDAADKYYYGQAALDSCATELDASLESLLNS